VGEAAAVDDPRIRGGVVVSHQSRYTQPARVISGVPSRRVELIISDIIPSRRVEIMISDIPSRRVELVISDIIPSHRVD